MPLNSQPDKSTKKVFYKVFLIAGVNILLLLILLCFSEYVLYHKATDFFRTEDLPIAKYTLVNEDFSVEKSAFRSPFGLKYKKRPVVIYGCSFAFGHRLPPEETMGYVLAEETGRPVYNYATPGSGIQHVLYLLDNTKEINNDVEYVMYLFISDHIYRMYNTCGKLLCFNFMEYERKNDTLVLKNDKLKYLKNLLTYKYLKDFYFYNIATNNQKFTLFMQYLQEINKNVKLKYPKAKFVFIVYDKSHCDGLFTDDQIQQIKDLGIDFISLEDIFGNALSSKEYVISETDFHPTYKAWQKIIPEIVSMEKM